MSSPVRGITRAGLKREHPGMPRRLLALLAAALIAAPAATAASAPGPPWSINKDDPARWTSAARLVNPVRSFLDRALGATGRASRRR